jgi:hypothetical protein
MHLKLSNKFNQKIYKLPYNLKSLEFGFSYNEPLCNLPPYLEILKFGCCYNQPIKLLEPLKEVVFGFSFNHRINIPKSLESITFSSNYREIDLQPYLSQQHLKKVKIGDRVIEIN